MVGASVESILERFNTRRIDVLNKSWTKTTGTVDLQAHCDGIRKKNMVLPIQVNQRILIDEPITA